MENQERIKELEEALQKCMDAIQINLQKAMYKDEVVMYEAFMHGKEVLNKD